MALGDGCRPFPSPARRLRPSHGDGREPVAHGRAGPTSRTRPSHRSVHDNEDHFLGRPTATPAAWMRAVATGWGGERVRDLLYPWFDARTPAAEVLDPTASVLRGKPSPVHTCAAAALSQSFSFSPHLAHLATSLAAEGLRPEAVPRQRGYLFGITYDNSAAEVRCPALPMCLARPACMGACAECPCAVRAGEAINDGRGATGAGRRATGDARRPGDGGDARAGGGPAGPAATAAACAGGARPSATGRRHRRGRRRQCFGRGGAWIRGW